MAPSDEGGIDALFLKGYTETAGKDGMLLLVRNQCGILWVVLAGWSQGREKEVRSLTSLGLEGQAESQCEGCTHRPQQMARALIEYDDQCLLN